MYEGNQAAADSRYVGGNVAGKTTAVWFANENDRLIKNLTELAHDRLAKLLPPAVPQSEGAIKAQTSPHAGSEMSQQLRDQNERLEHLIELIGKVDL